MQSKSSLMPIILRYLPPDKNVPSDLPPELSGAAICLQAFRVERHNECFLAGWACGEIVDGDIKISTTGKAVLNRMLAAHPHSDNKKPTVVVVEMRNEPTAWQKIRHHLFDEPHDGHIVVFLAANPKVYDASAGTRLYSHPRIAIFDGDGALLAKLNSQQRADIKRKASQG
jgi:hypothetical protein